jgi:hypothetical protein
MKNYSRGSLNRVMYAEDPCRISALASCMGSLHIFPYFFIPPQAQGGAGPRQSLSRFNANIAAQSDLVKISVI